MFPAQVYYSFITKVKFLFGLTSINETFNPLCPSTLILALPSFLLFLPLYIPHSSVSLLFWVSQFILKWIWGVHHHHPLFLTCLIKPVICSRPLSSLLSHHFVLHPPISLTFLAHPSRHALPIMPLLYRHLFAPILLRCPKSSSQKQAQVHTRMKPVQ